MKEIKIKKNFERPKNMNFEREVNVKVEPEKYFLKIGNFEIESDGSSINTIIKINGKRISGIVDLSFKISGRKSNNLTEIDMVVYPDIFGEEKDANF